MRRRLAEEIAIVCDDRAGGGDKELDRVYLGVAFLLKLLEFLFD